MTDMSFIPIYMIIIHTKCGNNFHHFNWSLEKIHIFRKFMLIICIVM